MGIEPALSVWESVPFGPVMPPDLQGRVSASDPERPLVTGVNGPLMARRTVVRPALMAASWSSPSSSTLPSLGSWLPCQGSRSDRVRLGLTRRTRPRRSASKEDGTQWLGSLRFWGRSRVRPYLGDVSMCPE